MEIGSRVQTEKKRNFPEKKKSKQSARQVRDDMEKTFVTVEPTGHVSPSDAHASDGSGEEGHTSDSEFVDSSHTLGNEEQTSEKIIKHLQMHMHPMVLRAVP